VFFPTVSRSRESFVTCQCCENFECRAVAERSKDLREQWEHSRGTRGVTRSVARAMDSNDNGLGSPRFTSFDKKRPERAKRANKPISTSPAARKP